MWCPKIIYVHLVKSGKGVGTPLLDLYFNADTLGSHCPKQLSGSSILCQSIQFRLNQAYGKSPNLVKKFFCFFVFIFGLDLLKLFLIVHKHEGPLTPNLQLTAHGHFTLYTIRILTS